MKNKLVPFILVLCIIVSVIAYFIGYNTGKNHVIFDSYLICEENIIYLEIDNNVYFYE